MKKLVNIQEIKGDGLIALLGLRVTLFCSSYFYTGKLVGVNYTCVLLEDAYIVYETGQLLDKEWKDAQKLPSQWYVMQQAIESFGILK